MNTTINRGLLGLATLTALLGGCAQNPAADANLAEGRVNASAVSSTLYNAIRPVFSPDPDMVYHNGNYFLTYTNDANLNSIVIRKASSVDRLADTPGTIVWTDSNSARCCNIWAPSLFRHNSRWYLYYTATDSANTDHYMYVLESSGDDPMGPYSFKGRLYAPNRDTGAIDGVAFNRGGSLYFVYQMGAQNGQGIWIAPLSNPWTISGNAVNISFPGSSGSTWDKTYNEAPSVIQRNGKTYIAFSGNPADSPDYAVGLLTNTDGNLLNAGSWTKSGPVMRRNDAAGVYGPGSTSFFKSPNGAEDWVIYHAKTASGWTFNTRTARIQRLGWNGDTPVFPTPASLNTPITRPAGDADGVDNLLGNSDLESNGPTQTPASWGTWPGSSGAHADADFTEAGGFTGAYRLTHYKSSAYEVYSNQTVSVANGTYTVKAWVVSGGGQNAAFLSAKNYGGSELKANIPATGYPNWQEVTIGNINVTSGQITVGVYSNANGGNWLSVDRVRLYRQ